MWYFGISLDSTDSIKKGRTFQAFKVATMQYKNIYLSYILKICQPHPPLALNLSRVPQSPLDPKNSTYNMHDRPSRPLAYLKINRCISKIFDKLKIIIIKHQRQAVYQRPALYRCESSLIWLYPKHRSHFPLPKKRNRHIPRKSPLVKQHLTSAFKLRTLQFA